MIFCSYLCAIRLIISPEEENDLIDYLENEREEYYVIEFDGRIIGSGGINFFEGDCARLSWDMIHPEFHKKGLGNKLIDFRLKRLKELNISNISVRTSQFAYEFYLKNGFTIVEIVEDYWAEGFDLYDLKFKG